MLELLGHIPDLLASPAPDTLPPEAHRRGMAIAMLVAMLGLVLIGSAVLLVCMGSRRRRLQAIRRTGRPPVATPDPWTESANRLRTDDDPTDVD